MKKLSFVIIFIFFLVLHANAESIKNQEYEVGVDDVLEINILQPEKLASIVSVSLDGAISFPYLGSLKVKGLTLSEIQEKIQTGLTNGYMKYPLVSVALKESRSRKFFIYGDVSKPGEYPLNKNTTILNAIAIAGGLSKYGSSCRVSILRANEQKGGYETIEADMGAIMQKATDANILLYPGDIITISEGKFFVYGEVNKPGVYAMEGDITVLKAIAIAGGFTKFGSSSRVKVLRPRKDGAGYETIKVNIKEIMDGYTDSDIALKPGDTVVALEGMF